MGVIAVSWKRVRWILLGASFVFIVGIVAFLGYWLPRYNCLCYKAHVHPGQYYPIDAQIKDVVEFEPSSDVWHLCTVTCPHGKILQAAVFEDFYTIREWN